MKYIIGFDGGGSKTRCIIGDKKGNIYNDLTSGPSNHQIIGIDNTKFIISKLYNEILEGQNISRTNIEYVFLGLAGADLPSDFIILDKICKEIFKTIPYKIVNDAWIIMRSGTDKKESVVSIYGSGANAGAINKNSEMFILRALNYILGGSGGGSEIASDALHFAFRSNEQTYIKSRLEVELPILFGEHDINSLLHALYPISNISREFFLKIPPLVFRLAKEGDKVCQEILIKKGHTQGQMVNGILKQANMINTATTVVLGGSIFKGESNYFIESMKKEILNESPDIIFKFPSLHPVAGSYLFALDELNLKLTKLEYKILYDKLKLDT